MNIAGLKKRVLPSNNYIGIFFNDKTLRLKIDSTKPITELEFPEFYDVKINSLCDGGCKYCYMNSTSKGENFENLLEKVDSFFGAMSENERPFQVAIGGGNPTLHPDFIPVLKKFVDLGIMPNYTDNGMNITPELVAATKEYCGGVALSCHPHLDKYWKESFEKFHEAKVRTNFHIIISDKDSIDRFLDIYRGYKGRTDYFVLLPYEVQGRAKEKNLDFEYLFTAIKSIVDKGNSIQDIAFGALFYNYLIEHKDWLDISLYEPESMSKFLDMKDMTLYPSSFNLILMKKVGK